MKTVQRSQRFEFNGQPLMVRPAEGAREDDFVIPGGKWAMSRWDMEKVYRAIGLKTFDTAMPQWWFDEYMNQHNGERPLGVWCYDVNRYDGEFFPWEEAIARLGRLLP